MSDHSYLNKASPELRQWLETIDPQQTRCVVVALSKPEDRQPRPKAKEYSSRTEWRQELIDLQRDEFYQLHNPTLAAFDRIGVQYHIMPLIGVVTIQGTAD